MDLDEPRRRRRGTELESAILDAAWDELAENGYGSFTIDAVAQRAGTSKPVIYRRWADKHELVRAAVRHTAHRERRTIPDTGSVREDLLVLADYFNRERLPLAAVIGVQLAAYFRESGTSPADLREVMLAGVRSAFDVVLDRAVARGEVDPERLTPRIRDLPFALYRHEVLMSLRPVPREVMEEIVDTIFLPLVAPRPH
jgi:AcrR family transcriptional regulator